MAQLRYNYPNKRKWDGAALTARPVASSPKEARMRTKSIPTLTPQQEANFWSHVDVPCQPSCCWEWTAFRHVGYGMWGIKGLGGWRAHRIAYTLLIGPIPASHHIDHLCRNPACVNPDHLQPVPPRVNTLRGHGPSAANAKKRFCKHGHEFTEDNTAIDDRGWRDCLACRRRRQAHWTVKRRSLQEGRAA